MLQQLTRGVASVGQGCKLVDQGCKLGVGAIGGHAIMVPRRLAAPLTRINRADCLSGEMTSFCQHAL